MGSVISSWSKHQKITNTVHFTHSLQASISDCHRMWFCGELVDTTIFIWIRSGVAILLRVEQCHSGVSVNLKMGARCTFQVYIFKCSNF